MAQMHEFPAQPRILAQREEEQLARLRQQTYAHAADRVPANDYLPVDGALVTALVSTLAALDAALARSAFADLATFLQCKDALQRGQATLAHHGIASESEGGHGR